MSYTTTITYDTSASLNFDSTYVEVSGGTVRLKDLGGGTYTTTPQFITSQYRLIASDLSVFTETSATPSDTFINYQIVVDGIAYYYDSAASAWVPADSTQYNNSAVVNSNLSTLFSDLQIVESRFVGLTVILSTVNPAARPVLTANVFLCSWVNGNPVSIDQCLLYAYSQNLIGGIPDTATELTLIVSNPNGFLHGSKFILPFSKSVAFDSNGYAQISVIETQTPGIPLEFSFSYKDGFSRTVTKLFNAIVPDQPTLGLNSITVVQPYSFG